jgi:hypothetical protein
MPPVPIGAPTTLRKWSPADDITTNIPFRRTADKTWLKIPRSAAVRPAGAT